MAVLCGHCHLVRTSVVATAVAVSLWQSHASPLEEWVFDAVYLLIWYPNWHVVIAALMWYHHPWC